MDMEKVKLGTKFAAIGVIALAVGMAARKALMKIGYTNSLPVIDLSGNMPASIIVLSMIIVIVFIIGYRLKKTN